MIKFGREFCYSRRPFFRRVYPSAASMGAAMKAFNNAVEEVARAESVPFVNAAARVSKDLNHFRDDVHYTPIGTEPLARAVAEAIIASGLIEERTNLNRPQATHRQ